MHYLIRYVCASLVDKPSIRLIQNQIFFGGIVFKSMHIDHTTRELFSPMY
jgi:hypothetical protein